MKRNFSQIATVPSCQLYAYVSRKEDNALALITGSFFFGGNDQQNFLFFVVLSLIKDEGARNVKYQNAILNVDSEFNLIPSKNAAAKIFTS
ncbi:unnamed protein product [Hymenolepis diminuta]|uniref:Uncharacterized protein n=1 Tax=Hymenolepis diminuta TaxID=6216 RepID=A0A564Y6K5_HYMDI|nr:unnamed protein product [Hymenolepis diminuta]